MPPPRIPSAYRRHFHLVAQVVQQFMVASFEKLADLHDDVVVILFRLIAGAGRHAPFDFEFDTGSLRLAVDVDRAGGQGEGFLDNSQRLPQGACRRVGAIIECAVLLHAANDGEARKVLFHRQAKIGVLLVVPYRPALKRGRCCLIRLLSRMSASSSDRVTIISRSEM